MLKSMLFLARAFRSVKPFESTSLDWLSPAVRQQRERKSKSAECRTPSSKQHEVGSPTTTSISGKASNSNELSGFAHEHYFLCSFLGEPTLDQFVNLAR